MSELTTDQTYALDEAFRNAVVGGIARGQLHKTVAPVVAQMLADERDLIAREIETERNFYARNSDSWDLLHAAARIARGGAA